jgi:5-amino-6-(5-phospho-D-ribitylamino)uracil phosphatase
MRDPLHAPVISHNGALCKDSITLETRAAMLMPVEAALRVIGLGRREGADPLVNMDPEGEGLLVYDHIQEGNLALAKYIDWSSRVVGDNAQRTVLQVPSLEKYLKEPPVHISFSGECSTMQNLGEKLEDELEGVVQVLWTIYPNQNFTLLDILHPAASKGAGLAAITENYGIVPEEVMAIGDNFNDLQMLQYSGRAVVMGNADERLRAMEGFEITLSNDEDGVAHAIDKYILGGS